MGVKILDSLGHEVAEIHTSSSEEAWDLFVASAKATLDVRREPHVERYSVTSPSGEVIHRWLVLDQDEPECSPSGDGEHDWGEPQVWGTGGGVTLRSRCSRCGACRIESTWHVLESTGDVVPGTVTYYR